MNPNHNEGTNLNLPTPVASSELPVVGSDRVPQLGMVEAASVTRQMPNMAAPPADPPTLQLPNPTTSTQVGVATAVPLPATPSLADDSDLIEKEWVEKAKAIVASTRDDPFIQNREVGRIKADYIKKRYNKDLNPDH